MKDFFMYLGSPSIALIFTAILSLIGVAFAAILNYWSNIKTNKANIILEERKAKYPYLKESFDKLLETRKQLDKIGSVTPPKNFNINNNELVKKTIIKIFDSCFSVIDLLKTVEPYLLKSDRDILMRKCDEIESNISFIQNQEFKLSEKKISDIEYDLILKETPEMMIHLKSEFGEVLSKELSNISDILRRNIDIN